MPWFYSGLLKSLKPPPRRVNEKLTAAVETTSVHLQARIPPNARSTNLDEPATMRACLECIPLERVYGSVAERFKAPVLKTGEDVSPP